MERVGRYELVARLGAGAMGVVWSARDPQLDRKVAIKLVHPELARSPDAAGRLLREARAMAKLSHRAVITVYDAGEDGDQLFLAMELVEGTTLGALLRARPPDGRSRDWQRWLAMFIEAGRGLAAAHDRGVLHRDFKPDNVLVDGHGRVRVGDFGLATLGEAAFAAAQSASMAAVTSVDLTTTGALLGTPVYMSPQQLRGEELDARADQFAFCVALYEAMYGARPFTVEGEGWQIIEELAGTIERGPPVPAKSSHVPHRVRDAILRGMAARPADRFPDMHALLAELVRGARPARWPLALGGLAVVGIGAVAIALVATRGSAPAPANAPRTTPAITPLASAKRLFELPIRATIAVSPDGKRLAIGSDRVEVRELDSTKIWSKAIGDHEDITHLEFDGESVRFGIVGHGVRRWRFATDEVTQEVVETSSRWCGRTTKGDVFYRIMQHELFVLADEAIVEEWRPEGEATVFAASPDQRRFAYLDNTDRFTGRIVVREMENGHEVTLGPLIDATAMAWLDDATLLFATGSITSPQIERVALTPAGFGKREILYTIEAGLFGRLAAGGGRVFGVAMHPTSRTRLVDGATNNVVDLDTSSVAAVLGWRGDEMVAWSRSAGRVVLRTGKAMTDTKIPLLAEPANATLAGDIAIVAARRPGGREVIAARISDGVELWRHRAGSLAVRCAGDRHAPCYAIRSDAGVEAVVAIDPATGELGGAPIYTGTIEDIAVRDDGARLLVTKKNLVVEIDPTGVVHDSVRPDVSSIRSLAYDPSGGTLLAGTLVRNTYRVGRIRDRAFTTLVQTESDILTLVRPDPTGKRIAYLARVYAPEVFQLDVQR